MIELPEDLQVFIEKIRKIILYILPKGYKEEMSYGLIGYVVHDTLYPSGYHCDPKLPLPFINLVAQKNNIAISHGNE